MVAAYQAALRISQQRHTKREMPSMVKLSCIQQICPAKKEMKWEGKEKQ